MKKHLICQLSFVDTENPSEPHLGLKLLLKDEEIPLSASSFLLYLYNNEEALGETLLNLFYRLAKAIKPLKLNNKSIYAITDIKNIIWFLKQLKHLKITTFFVSKESEKLKVLFYQKLPFTIQLIQYNAYLRLNFLEREDCLSENSKWYFYNAGKDSILCWDEKVIVNPNKMVLGFLDQFQSQPELVLNFEEAQKFIRSVYNHSKDALKWQIKGNLDKFLPKKVTPIPFLRVTYEEPMLNLSLMFRYDQAPLIPAESNEKQVKDSKKKQSYDRLFDIEQTFQQFLMESFVERDIPLILNQPGDIIRFFDEIVPELKQRGWKLDNQSKNFKIQEGEIDTQINMIEHQGWFSFDQSVQVGSSEFSLQEFARLMVENQGYVPLKEGGYAKVNEETKNDLEQLVKHDAFSKNSFSKAELLGLLNQTQCIKGHTESVQKTIDSFNKLHQNKDLDFSSLKATLRDYQHYGVSWIKYLYDTGFGGILADDMGLGKTIQCLSFILQLPQDSKHLIIGPASVVYNWFSEAKKFVPHLNVQLYLGKQRFEELVNNLDETNLIVTSYGILKRDIDLLKTIPFESLILDEGQNIKNPDTQVSKAVKKINSRFKLVMTGTPIENYLGDLWNLFDVVMPKFLDTKSHFDQMMKLDGKKDQLKLKIKPFVLRRVKDEVLSSLPEKTEILLGCALTEEQQTIYQSVLKATREGIKTASGKRDRLNMLTALLKLRQACVDATLIKEFQHLDIPSAKIELAKAKLLEIIEQGHKVVVFSQFKTLLSRLDEWREEQKLYGEFLHGGVATKERMVRIDRFQNSPEAGVFFVSLKAGGVGINLTAADYVFHLDPWWNPAAESQATDRVHRMGQTNKVIVYKFISEDTIEEKIQLLQQSKKSLLAEMVDIETETSKTIDYDAVEALILEN